MERFLRAAICIFASLSSVLAVKGAVARARARSWLSMRAHARPQRPHCDSDVASRGRVSPLNLIMDVKVVIVGDVGVGKTALVHALVTNTFASGPHLIMRTPRSANSHAQESKWR